MRERVLLYVIPTHEGATSGLLAAVRAESSEAARAANPQLAHAIELGPAKSAVVRLLHQGRELPIMAQLSTTIQMQAIDRLRQLRELGENDAENTREWERAAELVGDLFDL